MGMTCSQQLSQDVKGIVVVIYNEDREAGQVRQIGARQGGISKPTDAGYVNGRYDDLAVTKQ
jgi:hypothetical protein